MGTPQLNVLVLSNFNGRDANVIRDYLYSFNRHSRHRFFYLHSWKNNQFVRLVGFDFNRFDAIVLFWDYPWLLADDQINRHYVPPWVANRIAHSSALKVLFLQDEYRDVRLANDMMRRFGVNLMFTCVAQKDHDLFYPKTSIPTLEATYSVLTGYVPTYLEKIHCPASTERPIDIGYRSRRLPFYLGTLGQEKGTIADRFQEIADAHGFRPNISVREEDRIYGEDWLAFMRSCRFSLATESGASVVDFDGTIRKNCNEYMRRHPDATFEQVKRLFFADVDGRICVQTISPRIFETSAFENTLIMHEGHYEGMLEPDIDYIPVKKNYSNISEIVAKMRDRSYCIQLGRSAKEKLILSKKYNYAAFIRAFDRIVENHVPEPRRARETSRSVFYFLNYLNNDRLAPRGDSVVRAPHVFDFVALDDRRIQNLLVTIYSGVGMIRLLSETPCLHGVLLKTIREHLTHAGFSVIGLLKDIRMLAILRAHRRSKTVIPGMPFEIQVLDSERETDLIVRSQPLAKNMGEINAHYDGNTISTEKTFLENTLNSNPNAGLMWDHHCVGETLLLPIPWTLNCDVFLNAEGIWRFDSLNRMLRACEPEDRRAVLFESLFPERLPTSFVGSATAGFQLTWALSMLGGKKAVQVLARWIAPLLNARGNQRQSQNEVFVNQPRPKGCSDVVVESHM